MRDGLIRDLRRQSKGQGFRQDRDLMVEAADTIEALLNQLSPPAATMGCTTPTPPSKGGSWFWKAVRGQ